MSASRFLRFKSFTAPRFYEFKDPDTNYEYKANNKLELLQLIRAYRIQNELAPIEALGAVIDNYLCSLPEHKGSCEKNTAVHRGFIQYYKGGVALIQNILFKKMVTQDVAERRGAICAACPKNVFPDKKGFLAWSDEIADAATAGRKSKHHDELGNCEVCSCLLKSKVFVHKPEATEEEMKEFPEECWIKKEITSGKTT